MSIVTDIKDLHNSLKAYAMNLFLIPFWYIAIYLFNNDFYKSADNIIIWIMCIVISSSSSLGFAAILSCFNDDKNRSPANDYLDMLKDMTNSVWILCIWLCLLTFITYSIRFLYNKSIYFYYFIVIYYTPIVLVLILSIIQGKYNKK